MPGSQFSVGCSYIFAWGSGEDGQLGLEEAQVVTALMNREGEDRKPRSLVSGSRYSLAICGETNPTLYTWGWNQKATLGLGHQDTWAKVPVKVDALSGEQVEQACWGGWHGLAVSSEGKLYAWGGNENFQCEYVAEANEEKYIVVPRPILPELVVRKVSAGAMHSIVLTDNGDLYTWGQPLTTWMTSIDSNVYAKQRLPQKVDGATGIVSVAAGAFHNVALTSSGRVLAWGHSDYGQLGLGGTVHYSSPRVVDELDRAGIKEVTAGGWHTAAITAGGVCYIWGRGEYGRLGLGDNWKDRLRPTELPLTDRISDVTCGGSHSLVCTVDGKLLSFGRPTFGRLGRSSATNPNVPMPVEFPPAGEGRRWKVLQCSAGGRHTLALLTPVAVQPGGSDAAPAVGSNSGGRRVLSESSGGRAGGGGGGSSSAPHVSGGESSSSLAAAGAGGGGGAGVAPASTTGGGAAVPPHSSGSTGSMPSSSAA